MTVSSISVKRLQSLLSFDEGISSRELSLAEREIKKVLGEYFALKNKDVKITFEKGFDGININVSAHADKVTELKVL